MKKLLSLFMVSALILMGAGCSTKNDNLSARTENSGWQKKMVSSVLTSLLDDDITNVDLQGANITNGGTLSITSLASSPLTFSTSGAFTAGSYQIGRNADTPNRMQYNVPTGGLHELSVNDSAIVTVSSTMIDVASGVSFRGLQGDGGTSIGNIFDTATTYSTAGSKIASFRTGGAEKFSIAYNGAFNWPVASTLTGATTMTLTANNGYNAVQGKPTNGASAIAVYLQSLTNLTAGKIVSINNNTNSEVAYFGWDGSLYTKGSMVCEVTYPGSYPYTVTSGDCSVAVDTSAQRILNLPTLATTVTGTIFEFVDYSGTANLNNFYVVAQGSDRIYTAGSGTGAVTSTINNASAVFKVKSFGTRWITQ